MRYSFLLIFLIFVPMVKAAPPIVDISVGDTFRFAQGFESYLEINGTEFTDQSITFVSEITVLEVQYPNRFYLVEEKNALGTSNKTAIADAWIRMLFFPAIAGFIFENLTQTPQYMDFAAPEEETEFEGGEEPEPESTTTFPFFVNNDPKEYDRLLDNYNFYINFSEVEAVHLKNESRMVFFKEETLEATGTYNNMDWAVTIIVEFDLNLDYGRSILTLFDYFQETTYRLGSAERVEKFGFTVEEYTGILGIYGGTVGLAIGGGIGILTILVIGIYFLIRKWKGRRKRKSIPMPIVPDEL